MTKATAIGFFRHSSEMPTSTDMMSCYQALLDTFHKLGVRPTYFSADDGIGRGGYKKFGGAFHKRVMEREIQGYRSVGLAANPEGSDAPGYDSFLSASFVFGPEAEEVYLAIVVHEPYLKFGTDACNALIAELAQLWRWDYGFGFERDADTHPEVYLVGGGSNLQSREDARRGQLWYAAYQPEQRRRRVRDIFPYNMVGPGHLAQILSNGETLREFIEVDPDSALDPLADNLWLWTVKSDRTEALRDKLRGSGLIISE
ncbi:hypothetical protein FHR20_004106 [Sphingomonas leidyi]|uniref:Uncharacterized protein n=1 Tax=Sphingomonas leidyi TaxID=68569 RepID=A0A7X5V3B3_9SPHN|nr:hypothetical protein [Sphingomonas leidyi]NIJ67128.1 hypothetical protein [Sphingomonas leidyi]